MTYRSSRIQILLGTRKGTYVVEGNARRTSWNVGPPAHVGEEVYHVIADPRHPGSLYAAVNNGFWGPAVHRSRDGGRTWKEVATPLLPRTRNRPNPMEASAPAPKPVANLWHIEPGHPSEPKTLYLGADPHLLFRSPDLGASWEPLDSINEHPARKDWAPGAGGACLHTILVDPRDPKRMYIGLSAVGTFRTENGGDSWVPTNRGVLAPFLPDKHPETGQCVHHVAPDARDPDTFYRQDHGGMYVSHDRMDHWIRIGRPLGDDFGFAVASPPAAPGRAYFVRLNGRDRTTGTGYFQVQEWNDDRKRWRALVRPNAFPSSFGVHREGISTDDLDPPGIYIGTTTGQLFVSPNAGKSWQQIPFAFPGIHSVGVANPTSR